MLTVDDDVLPRLPMLLDAAISCAREAGALLRQEFHAPTGPRGAGQSAEVDAEIESFLRQQLLAAFPCGWLGEEGRALPGSTNSTWVVDPHDGTGAFLAGRRGSSVSIALVHGGRPVLGVVYAFAFPDDHGDMIAWAEGEGPVRRNGEQIKQGLEGRDLGSYEIVALSYVASQLPEANGRLVQPARFIAMPSIAYRLALTACGEAVAAVALNPLNAWDFAAGHALLRGAGGELLDAHGRKVVYDAGGNARTTCCFGGAPAAARALAARDWSPVMVPDPGDKRAAMPRNRIPDPDRLARAQGCLLGQVAGDALGALVEFEGRTSIREKYPDGVRHLADGGPWSILAGQPTDNSEMALALARTLVRHRRYLAAEVKQSYLDWYRSGPFDVGGTIRSALLGAPNTASQANGSLMRISPAGIFAAGRPELAARLAAEDSRLTHAHPACAGAVMCFAAAIAVAVAGGKADEMFAVALAHAGAAGDAVRRTLLASRSGKPTDYATRMGWVLIALQNAFFHLMAGSAPRRP